VQGKPVHQAPTPSTVTPPPDVLTPTTVASGVFIEEEEKQPETATHPLDLDALEATYAALPPERQAALRTEAETHLLAHGDKPAFLIWPTVLYAICCLLAGQEVGDAVDPPAPPPATAPRPPRASNPALGAVARPTPKAKPPAPTLRHLIIEDLQDTDRLLALYTQASGQGLIGTHDHDRREFFALAAHALRVGQDPCALFVKLVHDVPMRIAVSDGDEDAARARLLAYDRPPAPAIAGPPAPVLSDDARFVDIAIRVLEQDGWRDDPFSAVKTQYPEWTRARWDTACSELAQAQHRWQQVNALRRLTEVSIMEDWRVSAPDD